MKKVFLVVALVWGVVSMASAAIDSVKVSSESHHARIAAVVGE